MTNLLNDDAPIAPHDVGIINEACLLQRIPVAKRTLKNWRDNGLPFIRLPGSRRVLYDWASVHSYLIRQQNTAIK